MLATEGGGGGGGGALCDCDGCLAQDGWIGGVVLGTA
jgi:hypothetical protein